MNLPGGTLIMKLHIIFLLILFSLLWGCAYPMHNTSPSQNTVRETVRYPKPEPAPYERIAIPSKPESAPYERIAILSKPESVPYERIAILSPEEDIKEYEDSSPDKAQPVLDKATELCEASQDFWQKGEVEKAIESLDQAYALITGVETGEAPEMIRQKEELRFMISKRILEIYASRNVVAKGKYNAIPLIINRHVRAEIDFLTKSMDKKDGFFINAYKRSGRYRPYILAELEKAGLPAELSWLPLIESGFRTNALSRARALGLWQFIHSTGAKFGLRRDRHVDERLDPEKSTHAAIAYLRELHRIFGDWTTVLAAYNCGEGRVLRVIRKQKMNYLDNFWDLYEQLPRETARYVPRFLATLHIVRNPEKYGLDSVTRFSPLEYETVTVSTRVHLRDIAKVVGTPEKMLKTLNPELRYNIVPGKGYSFKVPQGRAELLISKLDSIPVSSPPKKTRSFAYHRVKKGETLSKIARKYGASVKAIARANRISRKARLGVGTTLKIPGKGTSVHVSKKYKGKKYRRSKYRVKRGDSLWSIANRHGTTAKKIRKLNRLKSGRLRVEQVLRIPGYGHTKKKSSALKTYQVKRGDIPFQIAKQHNMPLDRFLRVNRLTQRSRIYPGQRLCVD